MSEGNTLLYSDPPGQDNSGIWAALGDALGTTPVRVIQEAPDQPPADAESAPDGHTSPPGDGSAPSA